MPPRWDRFRLSRFGRLSWRLVEVGDTVAGIWERLPASVRWMVAAMLTGILSGLAYAVAWIREGVAENWRGMVFVSLPICLVVLLSTFLAHRGALRELFNKASQRQIRGPKEENALGVEIGPRLGVTLDVIVSRRMTLLMTKDIIVTNKTNQAMSCDLYAYIHLEEGNDSVRNGFEAVDISPRVLKAASLVFDSAFDNALRTPIDIAPLRSVRGCVIFGVTESWQHVKREHFISVRDRISGKQRSIKADVNVRELRFAPAPKA